MLVPSTAKLTMNRHKPTLRLHPQDVSLLDIFVHDIRSPLAGLQGYTAELGLALEGLRATLSPAQRDDLAEIHSAIEDCGSSIDRLLGGLLQICRQSRPSIQLQRLDVDAMVDAIAAGISWGTRRLERAALPPCCGDHRLLSEAFSHLILYAARCCRARIHITGHSEEHGSCYTITHDGPPLSPAQRRDAFALFRDSGMELPLALHLVTLHHGWIALRPSPAGGQQVVLFLPDAPP